MIFYTYHKKRMMLFCCFFLKPLKHIQMVICLPRGYLRSVTIINYNINKPKRVSIFNIIGRRQC